MKSWPTVKSGQVGVSSNIAQNHLSSLLQVISGDYLPQFTWKVDQKLNYVIICPYLGLSTLIVPTIYDLNTYIALFIYIVPYLACFAYIYPHLALFTLMWLCLPLIDIIWPYNEPYSPYMDIHL